MELPLRWLRNSATGVLELGVMEYGLIDYIYMLILYSFTCFHRQGQLHSAYFF